MRKTKDGLYLLNPAELAALVQASRDAALELLRDPTLDPNENALPFFVNRGYKLLYGVPLFNERGDPDGKPE